jgi:arsenate reductase
MPARAQPPRRRALPYGTPEDAITCAEMSELTVYEKPTCTTCRNLVTFLEERGIDFERVNYHVDPLPEDKIRDLVRKTGGPAADLLRKREPAYKEHVEGRDLSDDEIIKLMAEHPPLLQRPVVERGDRAVLARPVERVAELL